MTLHIVEGGTLPVRSVFLCTFPDDIVEISRKKACFFFANFNPMCVSFTSACCALFDVKLMEFQELRKARPVAGTSIDELMYFTVKLSYPE